METNNNIENEYIITITAKHCVDSSYMDIFNCPLAKAIKEQIPNISHLSVGGDRVNFYIPDEDYPCYRFSDEKWNIAIMKQIQRNEITQVELKITKI